MLVKAITTMTNLDPISGCIKVKNASNMFDKNYMQGKITWLQANPNAIFTDLVQYQIAQEAAALTEKSFITLDDQGSALLEQQLNADDYAEAAAQLAIEQALTADDMLNQIEGGI